MHWKWRWINSWFVSSGVISKRFFVLDPDERMTMNNELEVMQKEAKIRIPPAWQRKLRNVWGLHKLRPRFEQSTPHIFPAAASESSDWWGRWDRPYQGLQLIDNQNRAGEQSNVDICCGPLSRSTVSYNAIRHQPCLCWCWSELH